MKRTFCIEAFGKQYKELNEQELREFWAVRQRIHRAKAKGDNELADKRLSEYVVAKRAKRHASLVARNLITELK